jgi:hypothetical protein
MNRGHFYLSGFFTKGEKIFYFSLSDVRGSDFVLGSGGDLDLLYRTAKHYKDWSGGTNCYVIIEAGMAQKMRL